MYEKKRGNGEVEQGVEENERNMLSDDDIDLKWRGGVSDSCFRFLSWKSNGFQFPLTIFSSCMYIKGCGTDSR